MLKESESETYETEPNEFGLFRVYPHQPTHDPDGLVDLAAVCDAPGLDASAPDPNQAWYTGMTKSLLTRPSISPSVHRLLLWFYRHQQHSHAMLDDLVLNVIPNIDQNDPDIVKFSSHRALKSLDSTFREEDGWKAGSIDIPVPVPGIKAAGRTDAHTYTVHGVHYRSIIEVMKTYFGQISMNVFHATPFKIFRVGGDEPEPVYSEIYNSPAMYDEYVRVRDKHRDKTPYEIVIAAIMLWSDSTHLAQFGSASLWPIYLFFGNVSKWIRGKPTSFSAQHIAYLPKVRVFLQLELGRFADTALVQRGQVPDVVPVPHRKATNKGPRASHEAERDARRLESPPRR
jgi:hypothetical protein